MHTNNAVAHSGLSGARVLPSETSRRRTPHFYSVGVAIPGMSRPVECLVTAFSRRQAQRQARRVLKGIRVKVMTP